MRKASACAGARQIHAAPREAYGRGEREAALSGEWHSCYYLGLVCRPRRAKSTRPASYRKGPPDRGKCLVAVLGTEMRLPKDRGEIRERLRISDSDGICERAIVPGGGSTLKIRSFK
ncbi:hypothetical protein ebA5985 [Aromatoleum aromaticum EbN1]|uniref:Uncharacterized protein n=1 Tax=Aromatoleum aromaticum (strain DSM 19018 / LMG 30748 / EbN1) TaxID=76114 RepID=Q5NZH6_AROAE|nr:hypothetical protein ebA5985 [Aromatoleum aromaticum EbN1]